jgi:hypothetical protein
MKNMVDMSLEAHTADMSSKSCPDPPAANKSTQQEQKKKDIIEAKVQDNNSINST